MSCISFWTYLNWTALTSKPHKLYKLAHHLKYRINNSRHIWSWNSSWHKTWQALTLCFQCCTESDLILISLLQCCVFSPMLPMISHLKLIYWPFLVCRGYPPGKPNNGFLFIWKVLSSLGHGILTQRVKCRHTDKTITRSSREKFGQQVTFNLKLKACSGEFR